MINFNEYVEMVKPYHNEIVHQQKVIDKLSQKIETLKKDNKQKQESINKAIKFIEEHNYNAGKLYYKYDNKYLLSEIKEDLLEILKGEE